MFVKKDRKTKIKKNESKGKSKIKFTHPYNGRGRERNNYKHFLARMSYFSIFNR